MLGVLWHGDLPNGFAAIFPGARAGASELSSSTGFSCFISTKPLQANKVGEGFSMRSLAGSLAKLLLCVVVAFNLFSFASDWQLIGPEGGNVRSLAYDPSDPNRILLGTSAGQIFVSQDGGSSWALFAHIGRGESYVLDHIVFDPISPATIYVAGWDLFDDNEGGVFRSDDSGRSWHELMGAHGKSI